MTTSTADQQNYDPSTYWISPARNFRTSVRLHLQHLLFQNTLGHYLSPTIEASCIRDGDGDGDDGATSSSQPLRVADLGCCNGVWLTDLSSVLASRGVSARLDGYDINTINFPAPAFLPPGVTLTKLDVLSNDLPQELREAYDIVHVRAFLSVLTQGDPGPLLRAALALLKPGGWLQWEESRADVYRVEAPPSVSTQACVRIAALLEAKGSVFGFIADLAPHLRSHGFEDVEVSMAPTRKQDYKAWTEDYLMVWEELHVFFPPGDQAQQGTQQMTREEWNELFAQAVGETERGVVVHHGHIVTAVGRKPV